MKAVLWIASSDARVLSARRMRTVDGRPSAITGAFVVTPSRMEVKPMCAGGTGSTWKLVAGPPMILSMPFSTSTTPADFANRVSNARSKLIEQLGIAGREFYLNGFRRVVRPTMPICTGGSTLSWPSGFISLIHTPTVVAASGAAVTTPSTFGLINSTLSPARQFQFSLKCRF